MAAAMQSVQNVLHEVSTNHKAFCTQWGISEKELEDTPESTATTAYGAYIMDIGFQGDGVKLNMALSACLLGYGEVGLWLTNESKRPGSWVTMDESSNPYVLWINEYSGEMYQKAVEIGLGVLRVYSSSFLLNVDGVVATIEGIGSIVPLTEERFEEWVEIWRKCVMLEKGFWDMAIALS
jgi:hydroxymethylpyrimidine/phosphomethylpyrimidine kinase